MSNKVAASMTASIIIDKKEVISSALDAYARAKKEIDGNKLELLIDVSDEQALKRLKEIQQELSGKDYIIKFKNQGIDETLKSLDELYEKIKAIISGKGISNGKGIGNSIVDEKTLKNVLSIFKDIESHLSTLKTTISDVGDGEEFSPLLKMINNVKNSIDKLISITGKGTTFNMSIDVGSNTEMESKVQSKISNALQAYQRLFEHIKLSNPADSIITNKFFEFDINQYDTMMGKLQAYKKFIDNMRKEAKARFNGKDVLFQYTDKSYWSSASAAMAQVTKAFNEMNDSSDKNPLSELFGGTDLTEVISQLKTISDELGKISSAVNTFKDGINIKVSFAEVEKLTNKVKELEDELTTLKSSTVSHIETNILSGNEVVEAQNKTQELYVGTEKFLHNTERLISDIGLSHSKLIKKIQDENRLIEKGNEKFRERITFLNNGLVVESILGTETTNDAYGNHPKASKLVHTHPNSVTGEVFSANDMWSFADEYLKNKISEFELVWKNQVLTMKLPDGLSKEVLDNFSNNFAAMWDAVRIQLGDVDENGKINLPSELKSVASKYINSFLNEMLSKLGGELTLSKIDANGTLNQINIPKITSEEYNIIYSTLLKIKDVDFSGNIIQQTQDIKKNTRPLLETVDTLYGSLKALSSSPTNKNIKYLMPFLSDNDINDLSNILSQELTDKDFRNLADDIYRNIYEPIKNSRLEALLLVEAIQSHSSSTPIKDTFQGDKIEQAAASAKNLDKILDDVDIPEDSFNDVIAKFNIVEEKAQNIVKITKQMRRDVKGNPIESYNITYKNGSNEIYGESSKPQLLRSNDVLYNVKESETKIISEQKEKYEELSQTIDRYITVRKRIASGKALSSDEQEAKDLKKTIDELNKTDILSDEQYKTAKNRLESLETSVKDIIALTKSSSIDSMQSKIDAHNKRYVSVNNKPADEDRSVAYQEAINKYKNSIVELEIFLENFKKSSNPVTEESISEWNELIEKVDIASNALKTFSAAEKGSTDHSREKEIDKITKYLDANTKISKKARKELERYLAILKSGDPSANVQEIHTAWTKVAVAEREAGREGKSFLDLLKDKTIGNRAAQLVSYYLSFTDIIRYAREGINVVKDLNTALTEMRKVSDESLSRLKEFQKESFDLAEGIGATALEIQNSVADFMRLGYSLQEATKLSQDANIYANVGDMEINEATEHMISSIQAWQSEFKSTTEASEQIINRYNEVGNNFAITSADIGSAMERSAAALKAGGNDLNESIGLITAGNLIQQDADTTANALKVMSLRIRGSKAELEGMGETTDDLAESTSKLREQVKSLTGVDIMLDPNTYKSTAEIIQEIGAVWDNLTDVSQAATLELLAGKTRASTVSGLIENYETIEDVIRSCEESENSALEENQKYIDSVEGRLNLLKSQAQELAFVTIDDEALKKGISLLTDLLSLVTDLIDKIGLLSTVAIGAGGFGFFKNLD